jgi:hypothetical protein
MAARERLILVGAGGFGREVYFWAGDLLDHVIDIPGEGRQRPRRVAISCPEVHFPPESAGADQNKEISSACRRLPLTLRGKTHKDKERPAKWQRGNALFCWYCISPH